MARSRLAGAIRGVRSFRGCNGGLRPCPTPRRRHCRRLSHKTAPGQPFHTPALFSLGTANACYHVKRVFAVFHEPSIMIFALSAVSESISLSCVSFESLICTVSDDVDRRDSESLPVVNTSYRSVVTCRYSENWLIVLTDKLEISTGLSYCKEHARATGHGYAGQRIAMSSAICR